MKTNVAFLFLLFVGVSLSFTGCSTEKNRWINRTYHGTTTRYNYYFNARESIREGVNQMIQNYDEDYTELIPVYIYPDEAAAASLRAPMGVAIEKCQIAIDRHSIYIKNYKQENNAWIDDSYFLLGKAYFYEREFSDAKRLLTYVSKEYKHSSVRFDAMLWLAKTHIEQGDFNEARKLIDMLKEAEHEAFMTKKERKELEAKAKKSSRKKKKRKPKKKKRRKKKTNKGIKKMEFKIEPFPKHLRDDLFATEADMYIRQDRFADAIVPLETAIEHAKPKAFKTRLIFILAQIYQKDDDRNNASLNYARVIKLHPEYEMEFYARINRALNVNVRSANYNDIRKELKKMLKDEKNVQYFDQIYYALAEIELQEENEALAIDYLKKSVETSVENDPQKGLSFLKLATIHFDKRKYAEAQAFYDSTTTFLKETHESYKLATQRADYLTDLVEHLNTIAFNDSVQKYYSWNEKDLNAMVDDIIREKREEAERLAAEEELARLNQQNSGGTRPNAGGNNGDFWPYNPSARGFGFNEFKKKWGDRKLADNWRRSDKSKGLSDFDNNPEEGDSVPELAEEGDEYKRETYLKDIPRTEEELRASNNKIIEALWGAGNIYKEKLDDSDQAIASFEMLVTRYDTCKYQLPTYYQLYNLYTAKGNANKAAEYREKLSKFPNSEYYKIIVDPDYLKKGEQQRITDRKAYESVFASYQKGYYSSVLTSCDQVISSEPENYYASKYHMLRAFTLSDLGRLEEVEPALRKIIDDYPGTNEAIKAAEFLELIKGTQEEVVESPYVVEDNTQHFFIVVFPDTRGSVRHLKNKVSDFNAVSFREANLTTTNLFIDPTNQVILVKSFTDAEAAKNYYIAFKENDDVLRGLNDAYEYFTISKKNYQTYYKEKDIEPYRKFFQAHYTN